jgi:hypothetical protein
VAGISIPPKARELILGAMRDFLVHVELEYAAAPLEDARDRLKGLVDGYRAFQSAIGAATNLEVRSYVEHLINREHGLLTKQPSADGELPSVDLTKNRSITPFQEFLWDAQALDSKAYILVEACKKALKGIEPKHKIRGRRQGESWDSLVLNITEICEEHGLPSEVRKDQSTSRKENTKKGVVSSFVRMFRALEEQFPSSTPSVNLSRTLGALSGAIGRARSPAPPCGARKSGTQKSAPRGS